MAEVFGSTYAETQQDATTKKDKDKWAQECEENPGTFLLLILAFFEHVLDGRLVNHEIWLATIPVYLDAVTVIPFDDSVNFFSIAQHDHHRSARLHLFLIVEVLGVGRLGRCELLASASRSHGTLTSFRTIVALRAPLLHGNRRGIVVSVIVILDAG